MLMISIVDRRLMLLKNSVERSYFYPDYYNEERIKKPVLVVFRTGFFDQNSLDKGSSVLFDGYKSSEANIF